jgi:hypothetical protein
MLIDEWTNSRGSPIFHGKFKIQDKLSEHYIIQERRGTYLLEMNLLYPNLSEEQKSLQGVAHVIYGILNRFETHLKK